MSGREGGREREYGLWWQWTADSRGTANSVHRVADTYSMDTVGCDPDDCQCCCPCDVCCGVFVVSCVSLNHRMRRRSGPRPRSARQACHARHPPSTGPSTDESGRCTRGKNAVVPVQHAALVAAAVLESVGCFCCVELFAGLLNRVGVCANAALSCALHCHMWRRVGLCHASAPVALHVRT